MYRSYGQYVVFCLAMLSILGIASAQFIQMKPGACPPATDVGICAVRCRVDRQCSGSLKCCPTACGGATCTSPVTVRIKPDLVKDGSCPTRPSGPWVCSSRCGGDSDCRGVQKCCKNRCGAYACTKPEREVVEEEPYM